MTDRHQPEGEPHDAAPPEAGSLGDAAGEPFDHAQDPIANEPFETGAERPPQEPTEVESSARGRHAGRPATNDISGIDSMLEEGAPLEPDDLRDEAPQRVDELAAARQALTERTSDLQRLQAEYLNYKRRVERDRELLRENATYAALAPIVEVLDTIDRAREHSELDPGFQTVADQLERVVGGAGLVKYGEPGDAFDPRIHEALSHIGEDAEVEVTTCKVIAKAGYRIGDRVVRAAQVLVVDPA